MRASTIMLLHSWIYRTSRPFDSSLTIGPWYAASHAFPCQSLDYKRTPCASDTRFITPRKCSLRGRLLSFGRSRGCFPAKDHWLARADSLRRIQTYSTDQECFTGSLSAAHLQYVVKRRHLWSLIETSVALTAWNLWGKGIQSNRKWHQECEE